MKNVDIKTIFKKTMERFKKDLERFPFEQIWKRNLRPAYFWYQRNRFDSKGFGQWKQPGQKFYSWKTSNKTFKQNGKRRKVLLGGQFPNILTGDLFKSVVGEQVNYKGQRLGYREIGLHDGIYIATTLPYARAMNARNAFDTFSNSFLKKQRDMLEKAHKAFMQRLGWGAT